MIAKHKANFKQFSSLKQICGSMLKNGLHNYTYKGPLFKILCFVL